MAVELANAYISLSLETRQIPGQVRSALGQAERGAGQSGRRIGAAMGTGVGATLGQTLKGAAGLIGITSGVAALAGAFKGVVSTGMDFTTAMNTMQAVTRGSAGQMNAVSDAARRLGNDIDLPATSANDAALAMVELAKGGFSVEQSMSAAKGTLQLAAAAQIDAASAATIQSQALQAFGKDASFAATTSDILANAANASSAEIVDVASALQQSGTVANQFGVSMEDTATAIAMFANAGIQGSDAGTLLKTALLALTDQGKPAQSAIEKLGLTVYDAQGKFVGLPTLFDQLSTASKNMTPEMYQAATTTLFGSDAARLAGIAAEQGSAGFDKMRDAIGRQGAAAETAAAQTKGLPGAWERVKNSIEDVALKMYDAIKGPLEKGLDSVTNFISGLSNLGGNTLISRLFGDFKNAISGVAEGIRDILPAVGTFAEMLAKAAGGLGVVTWEAFNRILQATGAVLRFIAPMFNAIAGAADFASGPLTAMLAAFLAFKVVSAITRQLRVGIAAVGTGSRESLSRVTSLSGGLQRLGMAYGRVNTASTGFLRGLREVRTATGGVVAATDRTRARFLALAGVAQTTNGRFRDLATNRFISTGAAMVRMSEAAGTSRTRLMALAGIAQTVNGRFRDLSTNQFISTANAMRRMGEQAGIAQGRFGSMVARLGQSVPLISRMQVAFVNAAIGAERFGRSTGALAALRSGITGIGTAAGNMARTMSAAIGGGFSAALIGATIVMGVVSSQMNENKQNAEAQKAAVDGLAQSHVKLGEALKASRGYMSDDVWSAANSQIDAYGESIRSTAESHKTWIEYAKTGGNIGNAFSSLKNGDIGGMFTSLVGGMDDATRAQNDAAESAMAAEAAIKDLGMSNEAISKGVHGSSAQWEALRAKLMAMGEGGQTAAHSLQGFRDKALQAADIAAHVTPGIAEFGEAVRILGDKSASAEDKLKAIKSAMDALNPNRSKAEAVKQMGESIRKAAEAASEIGPNAFNAKGGLDEMGAAGGKLSEVLTDLAEKQQGVAATGDQNKIAQANREIETTLQNLAASTNQPIEKIRELYNSFGGGENIDLMLHLKGAPEVLQQVGAVQAKINSTPDSKVINIESGELSQQALDMLNAIGLKTTTLPNGSVDVNVQDAAARAKLALVTQNVGILNLLKANPKVDLNTVRFQANNDVTKGALSQLQNTQVSPQAGLIIDQLLEGKTVSMNELQALANTTADPKAKLEIEKIMANIATVNKGLDDTTRPRTAQIFVSRVDAGGGAGFSGATASVGAGENGFIRQYAKGGVRWGGALTDAVIKPGRGKGSMFITPAGPAIAAEGETGGEAFIPLGRSKRKRSTAILSKVAEMFGMGLVPADSMSAMLGGYASSVTKGLAKLGGVDKFADGGLRALAEGSGASRPLTGAPYVWGGVNWGDCSGAMSAFARYAVGLDPWGGRFSTATQGADLSTMGFSMGRGSSGDLRFGWYNGGAGGGHTAGTLPDGTNIEMGGGNGGGMLGGAAAGADDPQFTDHAYLRVGPSWKSAGEDPGGYVPGQPGSEVPGNGNYGSGSGSMSGGGSGADTSLSGRAGSVVGAFVEGQLADIFKTLYINDSPGVLGALAEYENSKRSNEDQSKAQKADPADVAAAKKQYEDAKLQAKRDYEDSKLKREQEYEAQKSELKTELDAKKIERSEYDSKLADLKKKYDDTELSKKREYDQKTLEAKQKYDDLQRSQRSIGDQGTATPPTDPGNHLPGKGEDTGGGTPGAPGTPAAPATPQDAVKRAFQPAQWDTGKYWTDTDWIVGKESGWDPKAQNPSSTAYGLFQFLDETWGAYGSVKTDDPFKQGEAGLKYIQQRYGDPGKARAFWEANGWYDKGGIADGTGFMAKGTLKPERILDPRQTKAFDKMVANNFESNPEPVMAGGVTHNYEFHITGSNADEIGNKVERKMRFNSLKSRGRPV